MDFAARLAIEAWVLYGIGMFIIICRLASRRIAVGSWKSLQFDDYIMIFVSATFTTDMWSIVQVGIHGSNFMSPQQAAALNQAEVESAIYGSKMTLVTEVFTLTTTWCVKACLLCMYYRLTVGLTRHRLAVKLIAVYCALGYISIMVLFLTVWCRPIYEYWSVPVKYPQCASYYNHMIYATAWNISSDLMLLSIPIPLVLKAQFPLKRKLILCCVFGLGVFNILTAILNRYYNFSHPDSTVYLIWYVGEVGTIIVVANIPLCWHLLQYLFRLNAWSHQSRGRSPASPQETNHSYARMFTPFGRDRRRRVHDDLITDLSQSEEAFVGTTDHAASQTAAHADYESKEGSDDGETGLIKPVDSSQKYS